MKAIDDGMDNKMRERQERDPQDNKKSIAILHVAYQSLPPYFSLRDLPSAPTAGEVGNW